MTTYRVRSGDMDVKVKTVGNDHTKIRPISIFLRGLMECSPKPENLGVLVEISGGRFVGGNVIYFGTFNALAEAGMAEPNAE